MNLIICLLSLILYTTPSQQPSKVQDFQTNPPLASLIFVGTTIVPLVGPGFTRPARYNLLIRTDSFDRICPLSLLKLPPQ